MQVEGLVNQSLDLIGYKRHIGNIYEGTPAARAALDQYSQTRDVLLQTLQPDWAQFDASLTLLKQAPNIQKWFANYDTPWTGASPPLPWLFEYAYPADCIKPLQVKHSSLFIPEWRPRPHVWRLSSDGSTSTILSNTPDAILLYIRRVTDINDWQNDFTEAFIMALAKKLQPQLAPHMERQDANTSR